MKPARLTVGSSSRTTVAAIAAAFCTLAAVAPSAIAAEDALLRRDAVIQLMTKVDSYQQSHPWPQKRRWIAVMYYIGAMALYDTTKDSAVLGRTLRWAQENEWQVGKETEPSNTMTCGQVYLDLYFLKKDPAMIAKMREFIDGQVALDVPGRKAWWYCDACSWHRPPWQ